MRFIKSETYFPVIIGLHLALWSLDLALYEGSPALVEGESPTQRIAGEVMSSWVITVFGFNLLMATRARWVERVFGGLDKMYLIHRRSGFIAVVLLVLHFLVVPRHPEFTVGKPLGFGAMVLILLGVFAAGAPIMKRRLAYQSWLPLHRLMGAFYVLGIAHAALVPSLISKLPLIRTYVLGMAALGVGSWLYRAFVFPLTRRPLTYTVTRIQTFGDRAVDVRLRPEGDRLVYEAGQFAFFTFEGLARSESHPFTLASGPHEEELRIVVKACGDFTRQLVGSAQVGQRVTVEGSYGHLTPQHLASDQQVWVAGGIGITPFMSLARAIGDGTRAKLIWSVKSKDEAFFDDELKRLADASPGLEYTLWVSSEQGHLTYDAVDGQRLFEGKNVAICGPAPLRDSLTRRLLNAGVKPGAIHSEEFAFR